MSSVLAAKIDALSARLDRIEALLADGGPAAPPAILNVPGRKSQRLPAFYKDEEVRQFIDSRLWSASLDNLVAEAVARFGKKRAPSRSALHRYRDGVRKATRTQRSSQS